MAALGQRKTHCKQGHKFDGTETWHTNQRGYSCRSCRVCDRNMKTKQRLDPARKVFEAEQTQHWRDAHPEQYRANIQRTKETRRQILLAARAGGCIRCGEQHPACLDFHHRDRADKAIDVGRMRTGTPRRLLLEIAKCDVLCANCHRKLHYDERLTIGSSVVERRPEEPRVGGSTPPRSANPS